MLFIQHQTLSNCINAYINVEMERNGSVDTMQLSELFNCSKLYSNYFIQTWLNTKNNNKDNK